MWCTYAKMTCIPFGAAVEKIVQVPVVEIKVVEVIREVPVESVRVEKIETFVDRPVVSVVTVERVVEKEVPVRIETIKEVIVEKEVLTWQPPMKLQFSCNCPKHVRKSGR